MSQFVISRVLLFCFDNESLRLNKPHEAMLDAETASDFKTGTTLSIIAKAEALYNMVLLLILKFLAPEKIFTLSGTVRDGLGLLLSSNETEERYGDRERDVQMSKCNPQCCRRRRGLGD